MKRFMIALVAFVLVLSASIAPVMAQSADAVEWNVQYYNNVFLSGTPVVDTTYRGKIDFDWGTGSPADGVNADNFSARFAQLVYFEPGTYRFTMRADDQARISIDERAILDTLTTGQTDRELSTDVYLSGGHQVQIDYREFGGDAYLRVHWQNVLTIGAPVDGSPVLTVNVPVLNVRNAPTTLNTTVLTRINFGQTFAVQGRNANSSWYQVNANGVVGWVSAALVRAVNVQNVPVTFTDGTLAPVEPPVSTSFTAQTLVNLRVRATPVIVDDNILTTVPPGTNFTIVGRNADTTWLQVSFDGRTGWVSARFVSVTPPLVVSQVPVVTP